VKVPEPLILKVVGTSIFPAVVKSPSLTMKVSERLSVELARASKSPPELVKIPVTFITELVGRIKVPLDLVKVEEKVVLAGMVRVPPF